MKRHRTSGFTLVELLVVITIIGILMGMLFPAIQAAKAVAYKAGCGNNEKQIALALLSYEGLNSRFPGYWNEVGPTTPSGATTTAGTPQSMNASWVVAILPQLDRSDLWAIWQMGTVSGIATDVGKSNWTARNKTLKVLICPANPPDKGVSDCPLAYIGNGGMAMNGTSCATAETPSPMPYNFSGSQAYGIFLDRELDAPLNQRPRQNLTYVVTHDGASCTLLISENVLGTVGATPSGGAGYDSESGYGGLEFLDPAYSNDDRRAAPAPCNLLFFWLNFNNNFYGSGGGGSSPYTGAEASLYSNTVNQDIKNPHARPSSLHSGGVNAAFCDGSVLFLRQDIDPGVFSQLCAPFDAGAYAGTPPSTTPSPGPPLNDQDWRF